MDEFPVDPLPHVDIKHGKRHKNHAKKGLDTAGVPKRQRPELEEFKKRPKKKESIDEKIK